ncbi:uncharacterized protein [Spinacia oleracea]|uniref:Uncharacterized protein isoform X2 n=1 Tax=Spinacia oleracea TaxID=3562 RepID=A0ABM3QG64_SPIOL|nr:uncharacterized protein LOC110802669 isoform X2 [Spinacia oleracea]XP_056682355.1 uncharacterized protein LOC110802669 isoform X2 [Spinacia oleracea]XP_056682356.1 uncharacterized protein LOC110802669 isoform X2 [Spinacia oleracea]XP_056682357.1 uncharacterized protein LOC110802669 isoform X2 [Spinacia oleracea]
MGSCSVDDNLYQVDDLEEEEEEEEDTLLLNEEANEDDQASILDDVANYIKSLKLQIEVLEETAKANPLNMKMEPNTPVISHVLHLKKHIDIYRSNIGPSQWDRPAMQAYCLMYTLPDIEPWFWLKTQCYQELINFRPLEPTWNFYDSVQWPRCFASMALSCSEFEYYYVHGPSDTRFPTNNSESRDSGTTTLTQLGD